MYFKLIEQCVTQIVLQKGGVDPDFHYTKKFDIDVDPLMDNMVVKVSYLSVLIWPNSYQIFIELSNGDDCSNDHLPLDKPIFI